MYICSSRQNILSHAKKANRLQTCMQADVDCYLHPIDHLVAAWTALVLYRHPQLAFSLVSRQVLRFHAQGRGRNFNTYRASYLSMPTYLLPLPRPSYGQQLKKTDSTVGGKNNNHPNAGDRVGVHHIRRIHILRACQPVTTRGVVQRHNRSGWREKGVACSIPHTAYSQTHVDKRTTTGTGSRYDVG